MAAPLSLTFGRPDPATALTVDAGQVQLLEQACDGDHKLTVTEQYLQGTKWTVQRAIDEITQNFLDQSAVVWSKCNGGGAMGSSELLREFSTPPGAHASAYSGTLYCSSNRGIQQQHVHAG